MGLGAVIEVDTTQPVDVESLAARITAMLRQRSSVQN